MRCTNDGYVGIRSGEATPNSPSRPHSSMSQQSGTSSVASRSVNLRPRTGTPRRPRPASIAGTGVSVSSSVERNSEHGLFVPRPVIPFLLLSTYLIFFPSERCSRSLYYKMTFIITHSSGTFSEKTRNTVFWHFNSSTSSQRTVNISWIKSLIYKYIRVYVNI